MKMLDIDEALKGRKVKAEERNTSISSKRRKKNLFHTGGKKSRKATGGTVAAEVVKL